MFRLICNLSVHVGNALHRYAPTNILNDAIRSGGLASKRGTLAMPTLAAHISARTSSTTGPRWLYAFTLRLIWSAMKMLLLGPVIIVLVIRVQGQQVTATIPSEDDAAGILSALSPPVDRRSPRWSVGTWPHDQYIKPSFRCASRSTRPALGVRVAGEVIHGGIDTHRAAGNVPRTGR